MISTAPPGERLIRIGQDGRSTMEWEWSHNRPPEHRPPHCTVGQIVLYRANDWGPLVEAEVVDANADPDDRNLRWPDPWPLVRLLVTQDTPQSKIVSGKLAPGSAPPVRYFVMTYESRMEGSAGWLPLDHEQYPRPKAGV